MTLAGKKVLITQAHLHYYAGSEIVTLELAEHFSMLGAEVVIASYAFGEPISREFAELNRVTIFEFDDQRLTDNLNARLPDIAWIHHSLIPRVVLDRAAEITFVFHHMSSILPAEYTLDASVETTLASLVLFESPRSMELHLETGLYEGFPAERIQVFGNPAPAEYAVAVRPGPRPRRLVVVSNHIPAEVAAALRSLAVDFDVILIGNQKELGANPLRVTPDLISDAGAVITIGKTVQYSIAAGVPVYLYDHFGGVGWLTHENFEDARHHNFSGRYSSTKSADEIVTEIRTGFQHMEQKAEELRVAELRRIDLARRMEDVFEWVVNRAQPGRELHQLQIAQHDIIQRTLAGYIRELIRTQSDRETLSIYLEGERAEVAQSHEWIARYRNNPIRAVTAAVWKKIVKR